MPELGATRPDSSELLKRWLLKNRAALTVDSDEDVRRALTGPIEHVADDRRWRNPIVTADMTPSTRGFVIPKEYVADSPIFINNLSPRSRRGGEAPRVNETINHELLHKLFEKVAGRSYFGPVSGRPAAVPGDMGSSTSRPDWMTRKEYKDAVRFLESYISDRPGNSQVEAGAYAASVVPRWQGEVTPLNDLKQIYGTLSNLRPEERDFITRGSAPRRKPLTFGQNLNDFLTNLVGK